MLTLAASIFLVAGTGYFPVGALAQESFPKGYHGTFEVRWVFKATNPSVLQLQVDALTKKNPNSLNEINTDSAFNTNVKSLTAASVEALPTDVRFDLPGATAFGTIIQDTAQKIDEYKRQDVLVPAIEKAKTYVASMSKETGQDHVIGVGMVTNIIKALGWNLPFPIGDPTPLPTNPSSPTPSPTNPPQRRFGD
jgi:hypothetical protein